MNEKSFVNKKDFVVEKEMIANAFNNKIGACALMGNLQAESGNIPYRLQGDFNINYSKSILTTVLKMHNPFRILSTLQIQG